MEIGSIGPLLNIRSLKWKKTLELCRFVSSRFGNLNQLDSNVWGPFPPPHGLVPLCILGVWREQHTSRCANAVWGRKRGEGCGSHYNGCSHVRGDHSNLALSCIQSRLEWCPWKKNDTVRRVCFNILHSTSISTPFFFFSFQKTKKNIKSLTGLCFLDIWITLHFCLAFSSF